MSVAELTVGLLADYPADYLENLIGFWIFLENGNALFYSIQKNDYVIYRVFSKNGIFKDFPISQEIGKEFGKVEATHGLTIIKKLQNP